MNLHSVHWSAMHSISLHFKVVVGVARGVLWVQSVTTEWCWAAVVPIATASLQQQSQQCKCKLPQRYAWWSRWASI